MGYAIALTLWVLISPIIITVGYGMVRGLFDPIISDSSGDVEIV